jgi:hypothetical protein
MTIDDDVEMLCSHRVDPEEFWAAQRAYEQLRLAVAIECLWRWHEQPLAESRWADDGGRA